jgi:hypothetical protein
MLYEQGLGYSAINTARSALSQVIICNEGGCTIGAHPWVIKFMKGIYNLRPPVPRYSDTWDVNLLLVKLRQFSPVANLSLKLLTLKAVALTAILLAARVQTLLALNLDNMTIRKDRFCFTVAKNALKQSRPTYTPPLLELVAYPVDKRLCIHKTLKEYVTRTKPLRANTEEKQLFISYTKPHAKVTTATLSRWIKLVMGMAGINTMLYKAHSVRAASTSSALRLGVPIDEILKTAGWASVGTFAKYYNKETKPQSYAGKVLQGKKD